LPSNILHRRHKCLSDVYSGFFATFAVFALALLVSCASVWADDEPTNVPTQAEAAAYRQLSAGVSQKSIYQTIQTLSSFGTRVAGYPGNAEAAGYVTSQLSSILGTGNVHSEQFNVTVPDDSGQTNLEILGRRYSIQPLWPNLVRTSTLPPAGVNGPLIYGGNGDLSEFSGKQLVGSIVLLNFSCGTNWLNAARLGAKAIVFIEPDLPQRGEAESKFVGISVAIPRFWISRTEAAAVEATALTTPNLNCTVQCNDPWQVRSASNIVAVLPGTDRLLKRQCIIVESYYDSMSIVPSLSPGAENACSIASMLEIARLFKENPPKRTVLFVATDAHFIGLQGARVFIDNHLDNWLPISGWDNFSNVVFRQPLPARQQVWLWSSIDLSSRSALVGAFYKGGFYNFREDVQGNFADIGRSLRDNAARAGSVLGFNSDDRYADGINPIGGKSWSNYLPGTFAFDGEVAALAGGKSFTFATCNDARPLVDTPGDTVDQVNIANVAQQTQLLACEYWNLFNDTNDPDTVTASTGPGIMPVPTYPKWTRQGLTFGYTTLNGKVLRFDPRRNFVPNTPIPGSLAVVQTPFKTYTGVRGNLIEAAAPNGAYRFVGLPLVISQANGFTDNGIQHLSAFHLDTSEDDHRGDIDYAPDLGIYGATNFPIDLPLNSIDQTSQIIVFQCVPTSVFDLVDQANLKTLTSIQIIDGITNGQPREYGYSLSKPDPGVTYVEDVAVLFSSPATRLKVLMSSGPVATRFILLNSASTTIRHDAEGLGYNVADPNDPTNPPGFVVDGVVTYTAMRVAQDMWNLDEFRIRQLAKYRIVDDQMDSMHNKTKEMLDNAKLALRNRRYDLFDSYCRQAWGYESRVYPAAQQTASDVVQGVLFYLFLMIPFSYFVERLFFSFPDLKSQLVAVLTIFVSIFLIFSQIHPAFDITVNPGIVLIAFIMLALSLLVTSLIWGKFEEEMQHYSQATSGVHKVDAGKGSIAMAAFSLGIANMRRRKARTVLTCITLVLLTFTVLSFTSIVNTIRYNKVSAPGTPRYSGLLLRNANWDALQDTAYRAFGEQFGNSYPVAPRSWFFGTTQGLPSFLTISRADLNTDVKGVAGYDPRESEVTHPQDTLIAGRWFQPGDVYVTILPDAIAASLGIAKADVGKASVTFDGQDFLVIGIIDGVKFKDVKDLDNEPITPVDFITMSAQGIASSPGAAPPSGFQQYLHLDPENVLFVPYKTLINLGGDLRSVGIGFGNDKEVQQQLDQLMPRLDLNLYGSIGGKNYRFSAIGATSSKDLDKVIVPVIIAGLIVLNTMLGSVFERVKEIGIFSSIGLSPGNIGMLFLAESLVYAVIGSVSGYLIGQGMSKIISTFNLLPGLYLNFSSMSAVVSTLIVVGVVLLSTLYPARKASEVATPAVDRVWKLPEPDGDDWVIPLPFAITGNQAEGVNAFLTEWFQSFEEQSVGDFLTQDIHTVHVETALGRGFHLAGRIWLAPFDLGVSQDLSLQTLPTELEDVFAVTLHLTRISGDVSNWKRVNRRFLNVVRKQFLIWRTLSGEQRERYLEMADHVEKIGEIDIDVTAEAAPAS
jgi:hypothetical protein